MADDRTPPPVPPIALPSDALLTDTEWDALGRAVVPTWDDEGPTTKEIWRGFRMDLARGYRLGLAAGRKQAAPDALRKIASDVVGVSDPAQVHDDERLRFGAIRRALTEEPNHA